jgi:4-aminobutyrate aminotransferase/(S)-3-amino-2-methylpropionate transaminase
MSTQLTSEPSTSTATTATGSPRLRTALPGPKSQALTARQKTAISAGVTTSLPAWIASAKGAILTDVDGNELIDLGSGIAVTSIGHAHPKVIAAVQESITKLSHSCFMVTPYPGYLEMSEALCRITPGDDLRAALFNSGAEAVENAVKIARLATGRQAVAVFDHGYHGRTNLTMAMTAKVMPYKKNFGPFPGDIYRAPMSYPFREPAEIDGAAAAQRAITMLDKQVGADSLAAVVIEPVQGEGGFIVPAPGFLPALSRWCTDNGIVFIADEIQSGFARTGDMFACEDEGIVPDMMTVAKGIAGGMPLAGVVGRAAIMDAVHPGGLGGTYGGNPVACAAGLATLEIYESENLCERARHIESVVRPRLEEAAARHPEIGEVRGRGAMLAMELVEAGSLEPNPTATAAISKRCHAQGVVTLTCGTYGSVMRLLPPLVITDDELAEGLDVLVAAIDEVLG